MFIKKTAKKRADGKIRTSVLIIHKFRDSSNKVRDKVVKSCGVLEDQPDQEAFLKSVENELIQLEKKENEEITFRIRKEDNYNNSPINKDYYYGHNLLEIVLDTLKIKKVIDDYQDSLNLNVKYRFWDIIQFFTFERILDPDSKRASYQHLNNYFGKKYTFSLSDVYRCFTYLPDIFDLVQKTMSKSIGEIFPRNGSFVFYDGTNYFTTIDFNDLAEGALRKKGVSKEHRLDPIVGVAVFLDCNGLPLDIEIYPGNESESGKLIGGVGRIKKANNMKRVIAVADKGLNNSSNIFHLYNQGDGFIFSQILRGKKGNNYLPYIEKSSGWAEKKNEKGEVYYKEKDVIHTIQRLYKNDNGEYIKEEMDVKALLYWNLEDQQMARQKRNEKIAKLKKGIANRTIEMGRDAREYAKRVAIDPTTKKKLDKTDIQYEVDYEKIEREEKLDGYTCIITSELEMENTKIREAYHGLLEVEATFRISKTDLEFRPIYHYKKESIISHFMICYIAITVLRLLQYQLKLSGVDMSVERLQRFLKRMTLKELEEGKILLNQIGGALKYKNKLDEEKDTVLSNEDEILDDAKRVFEAYKIDFLDKIGINIGDFKTYIKELKKFKLGVET